MAFFSRVMNYVFNELLVDALANSKTFQRFAVRTDKALREAQASGKISKLADAPTEAAKTMSEFRARCGRRSRRRRRRSSGKRERRPERAREGGHREMREERHDSYT